MISTATVEASSQDNSRAYHSVKALTTKQTLFDGVDLRVDPVGADFLGVRRHHRIGELLHLVAVGELDARQLAGLLQGNQLRLVFARLQLAAVGAGFLARLEDRLL